jgi:redox-sensitive bicupin YhaK (pirin superfamily)
MMQKILNSQKTSWKRGDFGIQILFPGHALATSDTGIGTIGRIDHAHVLPGTLIPMHPHRDDEILTYLRSGRVMHKDSEGFTNTISNKKLMLMNAGATFYHEELVLEESGDLEGLQIFIRPQKSGLPPRVQFHEFAEAHSLNQWRAVAGKEDDQPLQIRSSTWIYDMRLQKGEQQALPELPAEHASCLLYVFGGELLVNEKTVLVEGESIFLENELIHLEALRTSDLVLFVTDKNAEYAATGMYSGNQNKS